MYQGNKDATFEMPVAHCKTCFKEIDRATAVNGNAAPTEGSLSVCLYCGTISKFDSNQNLVALTIPEMDEIKIEDPEAWRTIGAIHDYVISKAVNN